MPRISIVIPFVNRYACLGRLLHSITATTFYDNIDRIFVVCDRRSDIEAIQRQSIGVKMDVIVSESFHASKKRNLGLIKCESMWVWFIDDDVRLSEQGEGCEWFCPESFLSADFIGFPVVESKESFASKVFAASSFSDCFDRRPWNGEPKWFVSACFMVRRSVALSVGGFDEAWAARVGGEDVDFCLRLNLNGNVAAYSEQVIGLHCDPCQGVSSNFKRTFNYGVGEAALINKHSRYGGVYIKSEVAMLVICLFTLPLLVYFPLLWLLVVLSSASFVCFIHVRRIFGFHNEREMSFIEVLSELLMYVFYALGSICGAIMERKPMLIFMGFKYNEV